MARLCLTIQRVLLRVAANVKKRAVICFILLVCGCKVDTEHIQLKQEAPNKILFVVALLKDQYKFKSSFVHYQGCNHTTKFVNTKSSSRDENIYSSFP